MKKGQQLVLFDYEALPADDRAVVVEATGTIRARALVIRDNYIEIGRQLRRVKSLLAHGQFGAWLTAEFDWSQDTAHNLMRVAELVTENPKFSEFQGQIAQSAMYVLAAPATPESARDEALAQLEAGERITPSGAKQLAAEHKEPPVIEAPAPVETHVPVPAAPTVVPQSFIEAGQVSKQIPAEPPKVPPVPQPAVAQLPAPPAPQVVEAPWTVSIHIKHDDRVTISAAQGMTPGVWKPCTLDELLDELDQIIQTKIRP